MRPVMTAFLLGLAACLGLLASCAAPKVYLQFQGVDPAAQTAVMDGLRSATPRPAGNVAVEAWPETRGTPGPDVPVLHIAPRAMAPSDRTSPGLRPLPGDFPSRSAFSTATAVERWARDDQGRWAAVPLFWEVWGFSVPTAIARTLSSPDLEWSRADTLLSGAGLKVILPGSEPSGRQALFGILSASVGAVDAVRTMESGASGALDPALREAFARYAAAPKNRIYYPDTLRFTEADFVSFTQSHLGAPLAFLEPDQRARTVETSGLRTFLPLRITAPSGSYAMVGTFLAVYLTGPASSTSRAEAVLAVLVSPDFQKRVSIRTGYMPANFNAPVLEPVNAAIVRMALQAQVVLGVTPRPADEPGVKALDDSLDAIRKAPDQWQTLLPGGR